MITLKEPCCIDISYWEPAHLINWDIMDQRVKAVIVKATEGKNIVDEDVHAHCSNIAGRGYYRSLYHFFRENDVQKQIDIFLRTASEVGALNAHGWQFEIPPVLDVEEKAIKRGEEFAYQIKVWLNFVESVCNVKPIIYTSQNFWNNYVCTTKLFTTTPPEWTANYPLWAAQYPTFPDLRNDPGTLPLGWKEWIGWQYNDAYKFEAIKYNGCDVNVIKQSYLDTLVDSPTPETKAKRLLATFGDQTETYNEVK